MSTQSIPTEIKDLLAKARPDQIKRLLADIKAAKPAQETLH